MRAMIDAPPKESGCMQFTPKPTGSDNCECGHTLYQHYMCGDPQESACLVCRKSTALPAERPEQTAHTLAEMMHDDAVIKLDLWKQNQALQSNYAALKQSHDALMEAAEYFMEGYNSEDGMTSMKHYAWKFDAALATAKAITEGL